MHNELVAVIIMVFSAASYGASYVFQHKGTQEATAGGDGSLGIAVLLRNRTYVIGVILFALGFWLHITALAFGSVAVVQPIIVAELIFIPPVSALVVHTKITGKEWLAILVVAGGLAGFLFVAAPTEGSITPTTMAWVIVIGGTVAACALLTLGGFRSSNLAVRAALLGVSAGLVNALMALTAKGSLHGSITEILTNPLSYITVVVAISTFATTALAFKAGPITISSPSIIASNPIAATLISLWLFGVTINSGPLALVLIVFCVAITIAGVFYLSKTEEEMEEELEEAAETAGHRTAEEPGTA